MLRAEHQAIRISKSGRHLELGDGTPFLYVGDTAWELFHRLDRDETERYLSDRARKGFSVVQAVVLPQIGGLVDPNPQGDLPLENGDPARPTEGWFQHVDWVVNKANELGLVVGMLPSWGSYWAQSSASETAAESDTRRSIFNPQNARQYGEWLGARYRKADIIWILGGDRNINNESERAVQDAMAAGLRAGDGGSHLMTYHPRGPGRSGEEVGDADWIDFHMCQSSHAARGHDTGIFIEADRAAHPNIPALDGEPRYEGIPVGFYTRGENPAVRFTDYDCRTAAWWAMLAGACGHTYGNNNIWQMYDENREPVINANVPWHRVLDNPGAVQMGYMRCLLESIRWWELEPVAGFGVDSLLVDGPSSGPAKIRAAFTADRTTALVYTPKGEQFTLRLGCFAQHLVRERWFDPRYGTFHDIHTSANRAFQTYAPPSTGDETDWLLVLDEA